MGEVAERNRLPGAYGLALPDLSGAADLLQPAPAGWPEWRISHRAPGPADEDDGLDMLSPDRARLALAGGGRVEVDRVERRSTFVLPEQPSEQEVVHPYLSLTGAVNARWNGWQCFHAGAVVTGDGGAWAVFGEKGAGKSSALGWLALRSGLRILTDDVLAVTPERLAVAGPRCVDLRPDMAEHLGAGEPLGIVGARERYRLRVDESPPEAPLRGWIQLAWGDRVESRPLALEERLRAVSAALALKVVPPNAEALVELVGLPVHRLSRPRGFGSLEAAGEELLALTG